MAHEVEVLNASYLYSGGAGEHGQKLLNDQPKWADDPSRFEGLVARMTGGPLRELSPVFLGTGTGRSEQVVLQILTRRITVRCIQVHDLDGDRARAAAAVLAGCCPRAHVDSFDGTFGAFDLPPPEPSRPRAVFLLGATLGNIEPKPFMAWASSQLRPGDFLCWDHSEAEQDPREAPPHFRAAELDWFRAALRAYGTAAGLEPEAELRTTASGVHGERTYRVFGHFRGASKVVQIMRVSRHRHARLRSLCEALGFEWIDHEQHDLGDGVSLATCLCRKRSASSPQT